jgi:hypothetical protein
MVIPCRGRTEHLHHSPVSCSRQHKGSPVPRAITGPPCHRGTYIQRDLLFQVWGLDASLMTFLCEKITIAKSKEVKTRWDIWQNLLRNDLAQ